MDGACVYVHSLFVISYYLVVGYVIMNDFFGYVLSPAITAKTAFALSVYLNIAPH